jgi:hypothetical protein
VTILGVAVSFVASVVIYFDVMKGNVFNGPVYTWLDSGPVTMQVGFLIDSLTGDDDAGRHLRVADGAHLHRRLHGRGPGLRAVLLVHRAVHVQHADAGDEQQLPPALLRLGRRSASSRTC